MKEIATVSFVLLSLSAISCIAKKPELAAREKELVKSSIYYRVLRQKKEAYQILISNQKDREKKLINLFNASLSWEKLYAAQALAYLGNDVGIDVLKDAAGFKRSGMYMTSSGFEVSEAAAFLLLLNYDFPEDFKLSNIANARFPEFDVFLDIKSPIIELQPTVKTPVESGKVQGTAAEL